MERDIITDSSAYPFFVSFKAKAFNTTQGSSCSAQTGISQPGIIIVQLSSCKRIRIDSCQECIQVFFVRNFLDTEVTQEIVIQAPADVVMTAEVILKYIIPRQISNKIS